MMIDVSKFWIEGILLEHFPQFFSDGGADLDGSGTIAGTELFSDFDCDSYDGNHEDYEAYLELNRTALSAQVPFFRWGEKLKVTNRIHQLMYLESDLTPPEAMEVVYPFISELVEYVNKRIAGATLSPKAESQLYYDVMNKEGQLTLGAEENMPFVTSVVFQRLDCNTSSFLAMAIGDERGLPLHPVATS
jgi:hypothetical protein